MGLLSTFKCILSLDFCAYRNWLQVGGGGGGCGNLDCPQAFVGRDDLINYYLLNNLFLICVVLYDATHDQLYHKSLSIDVLHLHETRKASQNTVISIMRQSKGRIADEWSPMDQSGLQKQFDYMARLFSSVYILYLVRPQFSRCSYSQFGWLDGIRRTLMPV